jgi:hypothetical protein
VSEVERENVTKPLVYSSMNRLGRSGVFVPVGAEILNHRLARSDVRQETDHRECSNTQARAVKNFMDEFR